MNDAVTYVKMLEIGANVVYTFDRHFANLPGVSALPRVG